MSSETGPIPYHVIYSERVRDQLRTLAVVARDRGDGEDFLQALKDFHHRLTLYPQFGEPLIDLNLEGQTWIGIVHPLVMRYGILESRRTVFVAALPTLLPKSK